MVPEERHTETKRDSADNVYFDVGNIRVTAIEKTWDEEKRGIRISAYKGKGKALFQGAEIAIPDKQTAYDLIRAITNALNSIGL
jgi:hypothetical protein